MKTRCRLILAVLLALVPLHRAWAGATAADDKPMGAWFVNYDKFILEDEFIWTTGAYIDSQWGTIDIAQLPKYSSVLIGQGAGKKLSAKENEALEKWVAAGGTLIFTGAEPRVLWDNKPPEWVAGVGGAAHWQHEPIIPTVQLADHPLLKNVPDLCQEKDPKGVMQPWQVEGGLAFSTGKSLVGKGNVAILYENQHGNGRIIYADSHFIPNRWPVTGGGPPGSAWTMNLKPVERQFWTNLVAYLGIPNRNDVIAAWAAPRAGKDPLAVWFHDDPPYALGGRVRCPPYPVQGDEFKEMRFDMGIGELVRRDFYVTTLQDLAPVTVEATDLTAKHEHTIPASQIRLFIQEKPTPDYPKASYFLVDPKDVEPLDSPAVKLQPNETYTYWIMIESAATPAGDYVGALNFRSGARLLKSVPIHVKVWPLHQPGSEVLHFEMEHFWYGMPGGTWSDPRNNKPELLKKYIDNLGRLSVDVGESWGDISMGYYNKFIRLRSDGRPIDQAISESPELFLKDPMPSLSFCGPHDLWWNYAIQAGMSNFSQSWALGEVSQALAMRVYKNDKLPVGSPEHLRFVKWFWGEYHKYLRERGLFEGYIKLGDEAGPEGIPEYLRGAMPMHEAGFKTYTTVYNMIQAKESIANLDPGTDMWQIGWPEEDLRPFFKRNNIPFDDDNVFWGTAASSFWQAGYSYGRGFGMQAARTHLDGVHLHGYLRWQRIEVCGVYIGRNDVPCDSVEAVNWGQGISDGRYLAQLYRMIDLAKKTGRGAKTAAKIESRIEQEVVGFPQGSGPGPFIPLKKDETETIIGGAKIHMANPSNPLYELNVAAKVRVFEMMMQLKEAMGTLEPDVTYSNIALVRDGEPVCRVVCGSDEGAAALLVERVKNLVDKEIPVAASFDLKSTKQPETLVLIGTVKDNPTLALLAKQELATEITPFYPLEDTYVIERLPARAGKPGMIFVIGGNAVGVEQGVKNLCKLLTPEKRW